MNGELNEIVEWSKRIQANIGRVIYGKEATVELLLVALLCRGHLLLEDIPGVGKTILARAAAVSLGGAFNRIQATPDLLPGDILGVSVYRPDSGDFQFRPGPICSNIVLVDEINRATPRTQSAFLEAMGENQVTVDGVRRPLPDPFLLIATENPIEFEGTFPLPEAQRDRFFISISVGYPEPDAEGMMLESQRRRTHPVEELESVASIDTVPRYQETIAATHVDARIRDYILSLTAATRHRRELRLGVSPRGSLALYKGVQALAALRGETFVTPDMVKELFPAVCRGRVVLSSDRSLRGVTADEILDSVLGGVPVPGNGDV